MPMTSVGKPTSYPCPFCHADVPTKVTAVRTAYTSTPTTTWRENTSMDFRFTFTIDVEQYPVLEHLELEHGSDIRRARGIQELGVPDDYQVEGSG